MQVQTHVRLDNSARTASRVPCEILTLISSIHLTSALSLEATQQTVCQDKKPYNTSTYEVTLGADVVFDKSRRHM